MAMNQDEADTRSALLLRDAEEALQKEKLQEFWRQWGSTIIGMAIMLVVGTGAGVAWREWRQSHNEAATTKLLTLIENPETPITAQDVSSMSENHAAIAWLSRASSAKPEELEKIYASAASAGDNTDWGWLARWNTLRLRMDNPSEDPQKLISDYEALANDKKNSPLAALAYTDAGVIAGERLKDPAKALEYLNKAEKLAPRATSMSVMVTDLKHLYDIRAQSTTQQK